MMIKKSYIDFALHA